MPLEEQALLYLLYSAGAVVLLFIFIIIQRVRIQKLEAEAASITLRYQQLLASPKGVTADIFNHAPFPACTVDHSGKITNANALFRKLTPKEMSSLTEFDKATGAGLKGMASHAGKVSHRHLVLVRPEEDILRHFSVVSWPLKGKNVQHGTVITFHEQTGVIRRKTQQRHFEEQLISLLTRLVQDSQQSDQSIREEVRAITEYLQEAHHHIRESKYTAGIDAASVLRNAMKEARGVAREHKIHLVTTSPRSIRALGNEEDLTFAIRSVLVAAIEHGATGQSVRINLASRDNHIRIDCLLPDLVLDDEQHKHAFAFGKGKGNRHQQLWQTRLSIARELLAKHGGHLMVHSHKDLGTHYIVSLASASKR